MGENIENMDKKLNLKIIQLFFYLAKFYSQNNNFPKNGEN